MVGSGTTDRNKEAVGMMALHEALRSVCLNSDWTYSVFWTIRPRPRVRGGASVSAWLPASPTNLLASGDFGGLHMDKEVGNKKRKKKGHYCSEVMNELQTQIDHASESSNDVPKILEVGIVPHNLAAYQGSVLLLEQTGWAVKPDSIKEALGEKELAS